MEIRGSYRVIYYQFLQRVIRTCNINLMRKSLVKKLPLYQPADVPLAEVQVGVWVNERSWPCASFMEHSRPPAIHVYLPETRGVHTYHVTFSDPSENVRSPWL